MGNETPLIVDEHGSGLYQRADGSRAWVDRENPEDRWIRDQSERAEAEADAYEREQEIEAASVSERERWCAEDDEWPWRRREKPRGLMYGLEDRRAAPAEEEQ